MEISEQLKERLKTLESVDFGGLARTKEFGSAYNFKKPADVIKEAYSDLIKVIENANHLKLPKNQINKIDAVAQRIVEIVKRIKEFKLEGNEANASTQRQDIHNQVENLYQDNLEHIQPLIERAELLSKVKSTKMDSETSQVLAAIKKIKQMSEEAEKEKNNLSTTIKEVRDSLGKEGAGFSSQDFQNQAREHENAAYKWFWASIISIVTFLVVVVLLFALPQLSVKDLGTDYPRIIQITLLKVVILSIGYLAIYQCIRGYKINRHLYVLNRHRQITMSVYSLMTGATSDPEQSHIILGQAAKAIFEPGTTGYLDSDDNPNPINLTEIVHRVGDKLK